MSLISRVTLLAQAIGADFKALTLSVALKMPMYQTQGSNLVANPSLLANGALPASSSTTNGTLTFLSGTDSTVPANCPLERVALLTKLTDSYLVSVPMQFVNGTTWAWVAPAETIDVSVVCNNVSGAAASARLVVTQYTADGTFIANTRVLAHDNTVGGWQTLSGTLTLSATTRKIQVGMWSETTNPTGSQMYFGEVNLWRRRGSILNLFNSPTLTGVPAAPTPAVGTSTTQIQTTAGALAQMQAFGLGAVASPLMADADVIGVTQANRVTSNTSNRPLSLSGLMWSVAFQAGNYGAQLYVTSTSRLLFRYNSGSASAWVEAAPLDSAALTGIPTAPTPAATVATTQLQTTAGSLAQMQQFGLGLSTRVVSADMNALTTNMFFGAAGSSTTNKPTASTAGVGLHLAYSSTYNGQLYMSMAGTDAGTLYTRSYLNSVQGSWVPMAPSANPVLTGVVQVAADTTVVPHLSATLAPALRASGFAGAQSSAIAASAYSYSTVTFAASYWGTRSGGAVGAHTAMASGRAIMSMIAAASDGAAYQRIAQIDMYTAEATTSSTSAGEIRFLTTPTGAVTPALAMTLSATKNLAVVGGITAGTTIVAAGPVKCGQYTLTTLPSASAYSGYEIDVTDATGGAKRCRSNGTNWLILNTTTTVS